MNPSIALSALPRGQRARIVAIRGDGALTRKLLEMGIEEGHILTYLHKGLFGGPLAIRLNDRMIALRQRDAAQINVEML